MSRQIEDQFREILKSHGFAAAAETMKLEFLSSKRIRTMIDSWKNYPTCMNVFPSQLSPKNYPDI